MSRRPETLIRLERLTRQLLWLARVAPSSNPHVLTKVDQELLLLNPLNGRLRTPPESMAPKTRLESHLWAPAKRVTADANRSPARVIADAWPVDSHIFGHAVFRS